MGLNGHTLKRLSCRFTKRRLVPPHTHTYPASPQHTHTHTCLCTDTTKPLSSETLGFRRNSGKQVAGQGGHGWGCFSSFPQVILPPSIVRQAQEDNAKNRGANKRPASLGALWVHAVPIQIQAEVTSTETSEQKGQELAEGRGMRACVRIPLVARTQGHGVGPWSEPSCWILQGGVP